jgi:CTP:molybdopterin cytidylyltransferase MocA
MDKPLSLKQLSEIVERNPAALSVVAAMPRITVDDIAYAISKMAIDGDVARDVVATSSGRPLADVQRGLLTSIQAAVVAAHTIAAHTPQSIGEVFITAVAPGFGNEIGSVQ